MLQELLTCPLHDFNGLQAFDDSYLLRSQTLPRQVQGARFKKKIEGTDL